MATTKYELPLVLRQVAPVGRIDSRNKTFTVCGTEEQSTFSIRGCSGIRSRRLLQTDNTLAPCFTTFRWSHWFSLGTGQFSMELINRCCCLSLPRRGNPMIARGVRSRRRLEPLVLRQKMNVAPEGQSNAALVIGSPNGGFAVALSGLFIAGQSCFPPGQARGS